MNQLADMILAELEACKTAGDIHIVADRYRKDVMAMRLTDEARYHHIVNAKKYHLEALRREEGE